MFANPGVTLASAAITGYQRYLSPHKGFRCAHCVLHQGLSCSEAVKRLIRKHGLIGAWSPVRQRFAECKAALVTLQAMAQAQAEGGKKKKEGGDSSCDFLDCGDLGCDVCDCSL